MQFTKDPDESMTIVEEAIDFVRKAMEELRQKESRVEWQFYATGHSLGAFLANAVTVELDPDIKK
jgi:poly(3-hydroxybutyrate) depolymerase